MSSSKEGFYAEIKRANIAEARKCRNDFACGAPLKPLEFRKIPPISFLRLARLVTSPAPTPHKSHSQLVHARVQTKQTQNPSLPPPLPAGLPPVPSPVYPSLAATLTLPAFAAAAAAAGAGGQTAARDHHDPGGAMREPDRDGVLEAALPRARHRQGRTPRGLRHPGASRAPSLLSSRAGCGVPGG